MDDWKNDLGDSLTTEMRPLAAAALTAAALTAAALTAAEANIVNETRKVSANRETLAPLNRSTSLILVFVITIWLIFYLLKLNLVVFFRK